MGTCWLREEGQAAEPWDVGPRMGHELDPCRGAVADGAGLDPGQVGIWDPYDGLQSYDAAY